MAALAYFFLCSRASLVWWQLSGSFSAGSWAQTLLVVAPKTSGGSCSVPSTQGTFKGLVMAPAHAIVVNPVTSLLVVLMDSGMSQSAAEVLLRCAIGLPPSVNLLSYNAPLKAYAGTATAKSIMTKYAEVTTVIDHGASVLMGSNGALAPAAAWLGLYKSTAQYFAKHHAAGTNCASSASSQKKPSPPPPPPLPPIITGGAHPSPSPPFEVLCSNSYLCSDLDPDVTTHYTSNGVCDDGGPGSETSWCPLGTDCADCGPRVTGEVPLPPPPPSRPPLASSPPPIPADQLLCSNPSTCSDMDPDWITPFTRNGVCDDGGPGSEYSRCAFGTDCADCGPRAATDERPPPPPPLHLGRRGLQTTGGNDGGGLLGLLDGSAIDAILESAANATHTNASHALLEAAANATASVLDAEAEAGSSNLTLTEWYAHLVQLMIAAGESASEVNGIAAQVTAGNISVGTATSALSTINASVVLEAASQHKPPDAGPLFCGDEEAANYVPGGTGMGDGVCSYHSPPPPLPPPPHRPPPSPEPPDPPVAVAPAASAAPISAATASHAASASTS